MVETDPSSPAVGVNVGAVRQIITLDLDHPTAVVQVPILAGAPNPGEVDVDVTITPVNPRLNLEIRGPLTPRILASKDVLDPTIVKVQDNTPKAIVITFSKPIDPAGASNVNNDSVQRYWNGGKTRTWFVGG